MARYIAVRFSLVIPQMILISIATFILIRLLPGDPARLQLGPLAPDDGIAQLREELKLDESLPAQYWAYIERLGSGDLGRSWVNQSNVADDLRERVPATLELLTLGMLVILLVFIPLGIATASSAGLGVVGRLLSRATFGYGLLAGALPDFWLGLLLIFVFFTTFGVVSGPEGRLAIGETEPDQVTGFYTVDALIAGDFPTFVSALEHLLLPVITLSFVYGAIVLKMTQASMSRALRSESTVYAQALGLRQSTVLWWAFRSAAPPVVVVVGVVSGYLLGGAVLIETVFGLNGLGQYAVQSVTSLDYSPIQAFVLVAAVFTMLVYLTVDIVYFALDPRVRDARRTARRAG